MLGRRVSAGGRTSAFVAGRAATAADLKLLGAQLKVLKKQSDSTPAPGPNPKYRIVIRGDKDTHALVIHRVLNAAGEAGIEDISFAVYNREGE